MSCYIKIHGWDGQNPEVAIARFAKVFHFSVAQAAEIMQSVRKGQAWQFDKAISQLQSEKARVFLQSLGYDAELTSVVALSGPVAEKKAPSEILVAPMEALPRKSPMDFLKTFKLDGFFGGSKKSPPSSRQSDIENTKPLKKSFFDFLKKKAAVPFPETAKTVPGTLEETIDPLPKKSFLDFLKKKKADSAPEIKKAEPQAYRQKSDMASIAFIFVLSAAASLSPYYYGIRAEAILNELMPRMFQKGTVFKFKTYDRGWLKSRAEFLVSSPTGVVFQGVSEVEHGPFSLEELLTGNINYFQAHIESKIPVIASKTPDPIESLVMKGYFVKKGNIYKMDLLVLEGALNVNGKLIPAAQ